MSTDQREPPAADQDPDAVEEDSEAITDDISGESREPSAAELEMESIAREPSSGRGGRLLPLLALLVALISAAAAGFLWWQYRQFYVALDEADANGQAALTRARAEMVALEDRVTALQEADGGLENNLQRLDGNLSRIQPRLLEYEERIQAIQGVSFDARRIWLAAEAQYLLSLANNELLLAGRWEGARRALVLADDKLRELANPALTPVREEIAAALQALEGVELPDVEGLSLTLGQLAQRVPELPLRAEDMANFAPQQGPDDVPPGLERAWASLKAAIAAMIRIDRRDEPVQRALTSRESELVRWGTQLELAAARLALLRGEQDSFRQSIAAAIGNLSTYFDSGEPTVQSAVELLTQVQGVAVDPPRPDISQPLNTLRRLTADSQGQGQ